jgi:hypothetical protein
MFLLDWDHFEGFVKFPLDDTTRTTGKQGVTRDVKSSKYATDEALRGMVAAEKGVVRREVEEVSPTTRNQDFPAETQCSRHLPQMESKYETYAERSNVSNKVEETQGSVVPSKEVIQLADKLYAVRAIEEKGKGLVAMTKIAKGVRILSEDPIFKVPRVSPDIKAMEHTVTNEVKRLNEDEQRAFFDLANIYGQVHSQALGIARTKVLPLGSKARSGGLFLEASRINHSCRHNTQNTWNDNVGRLTIHALRDIEEGQEITISYLASTSEYAERQRFLREKFKFDCKCTLCSLPRSQRKHSDTRLRKLQDLNRSIGAFFWGDLEPEEALHLVHMMFGLFDEEGIWDAGIARAYNDAYEIAFQNDDESRSRIFAERACDARRLIEGDDSPVTAKMKRSC